MRFCPTCGASVSDTARFCPECGNRVPLQRAAEPVDDYEPDGMYEPSDDYESVDDYEPDAYADEPYDDSRYTRDPYEKASYSRKRREAEEERYYKEDRRTMTLGIFLAVLICVVGVALYVVVSNMLKQEPTVDVGNGFGNKPVQVDTNRTDNQKTKTQNQKEEKTPETEEQQPEEQQPAVLSPETVPVQASVLPAGQVNLDGYQTCGVAACQASSVLEDGGIYHVAEYMVDGSPATSWQEGSDGHGIGDWVYFQLDRPYAVKALTFEMGNWKSEQLFYANDRPETVLLKLDDQEFYLTFPDGMQAYTVELSGETEVSTITLQMISVHGGDSWDDCCISEMTVYGH